MAQVSILVKSKGIMIIIDDRQYTLEASDTPHIIPLEPGHHTILSMDLNAGKKMAVGVAGTVLKSAMGFGMGMMAGKGIKTVSSIIDSDNAKRDAAKENSMDEFDLADGETVRYRCRTTLKGFPKLDRLF